MMPNAGHQAPPSAVACMPLLAICWPMSAFGYASKAKLLPEVGEERCTKVNGHLLVRLLVNASLNEHKLWRFLEGLVQIVFCGPL
jgi:hypothetical protein